MKKSALAVVRLMLCPTVFFLQACEQAPHDRAFFQSATLNAQPARLLLDTGALAQRLLTP